MSYSYPEKRNHPGGPFVEQTQPAVVAPVGSMLRAAAVLAQLSIFSLDIAGLVQGATPDSYLAQGEMGPGL
ncbi:hypothetical protein MKZ38_005587 [Zalerion maritima]|uniref:Uncharacterized protein n=1 Tax=Zalerion maritima TaxID=339359 RepID=A0AAD5WNX2_9PEZI|nr:hypothetical protein MKZ38_005587 [Zalerion maritima]